MKNYRVLYSSCFHTTYLKNAAGNTSAQQTLSLVNHSLFSNIGLFFQSVQNLLKNKNFLSNCILSSKNGKTFSKFATLFLFFTILYSIFAEILLLRVNLSSKNGKTSSIYAALLSFSTILSSKNDEKCSKFAIICSSAIKHSPDSNKLIWNYLPGGYLTQRHLAKPNRF